MFNISTSEMIKRVPVEEVNDALDLIDDWIIYWGFDKNWDFNDKGREGKEVYDDLYNSNE